MPDIPVSKLIQDGSFPVHQLERITTAPVSVFTELCTTQANGIPNFVS